MPIGYGMVDERTLPRPAGERVGKKRMNACVGVADEEQQICASGYRVPQIVIIGARSTVQSEWELHSKLNLRNSLDI
jgi:hypothetical protein